MKEHTEAESKLGNTLLESQKETIRSICFLKSPLEITMLGTNEPEQNAEHGIALEFSTLQFEAKTFVESKMENVPSVLEDGQRKKQFALIFFL